MANLIQPYETNKLSTSLFVKEGEVQSIHSQLYNIYCILLERRAYTQDLQYERMDRQVNTLSLSLQNTGAAHKKVANLTLLKTAGAIVQIAGSFFNPALAQGLGTIFSSAGEIAQGREQGEIQGQLAKETEIARTALSQAQQESSSSRSDLQQEHEQYKRLLELISRSFPA